MKLTGCRPANVFQLELLALFSRGRLLAMKLGLSLLLGLPFAVMPMPPRAREAGLAMLVLFTGFFGAAVAAARRRADGHLERLRLLPVPAGAVAADLLLSGALIDFLQTAPLMVLFVLIHGRDPSAGAVLHLAGTLAGVLLVLNLLGLLVGLAMRSNSEVHLAAALGAGLIALLSGAIPAPPVLAGLAVRMARWHPLSRLMQALAGLAGDGAGGGRPEPFAAILPAFFLAVTILRALGGREALKNHRVVEEELYGPAYEDVRHPGAGGSGAL